MDSGLYAACAGLIARTQTLDMAANNLANTSTTGYRGQQPTFQTLLANAGDQVINRYTAAVDDYGVTGGTRTDTRQGSFTTSGNPLDVALVGPGYLSVQDSSGNIHYTRNGALQLNTKHQLTTQNGDLVLGQQNLPITIPDGELSISGDGTISVAGALAGKLSLVEFSSDTTLTNIGSSYYDAPAAAAKSATNTVLRQATLESSNVDAVSAAVNLIGLQRNAEMLTKAMSVFHNDLNRMAVEDLPKV